MTGLSRRRSGLTSLSAWLVSLSPNLKRQLWRLCYEALAARYRSARWSFMNFGYAETDPAKPLLGLSASDEPNRYCIQLYDHVLRPARALLPGARVLEVGCGRGGGCDYVFRAGAPESMTGLDFSAQAVSLCRDSFAVPGLSFEQGDAEALPFPDASFDIVLNVESSHCYGSMERFMGEVARVLRPGGFFLWADMRPVGEAVARALTGSGFQLVSGKTITPNVLLSLDQMTEVRARMILSMAPRPFRKGLRDFAGLSGSRLHEALRTGALEYLSCALQKPGGSSSLSLENGRSLPGGAGAALDRFGKAPLGCHHRPQEIVGEREEDVKVPLHVSVVQPVVFPEKQEPAESLQPMPARHMHEIVGILVARVVEGESGHRAPEGRHLREPLE